MSITRKTDGNFGNVSAGVLFPKSRINENGDKKNKAERVSLQSLMQYTGERL